MSDELKPCPFCESGDLEIQVDGAYFWVECNTCHATGKLHMLFGPNANSAGDATATKSWNTRPIEDALRARVEELEAKLVEAENRTVRRNIVCPRCFEFVEAEVTLGHMVCPACENEVIV